MVKAGHPQEQAVAAALRNAREGDQAMEDKPAGDNGVFGMSNIGQEPPPHPAPEFEQAQLHPNASTPPEPALATNYGLRDAAVGYGGVAGGAVEQQWGDKGLGDALPAGMGIGDICRFNGDFWSQWKGV
jgi:hypothetical protein